MIKINLLPPQRKKELEIADFSQRLGFMGIWLAGFLIVFALLLLSSSLFLSILLDAQNELIEIRMNDTKTQRLTEIEKEINTANQQLDRIYAKQDEAILWTPIMEELSKLTPAGIYLTNFSYQASTNKININGWANNRDKLITFQDLLKESSSFENIESPLTNLIKQNDINFSFSLEPN